MIARRWTPAQANRLLARCLLDMESMICLTPEERRRCQMLADQVDVASRRRKGMLPAPWFRIIDRNSGNYVASYDTVSEVMSYLRSRRCMTIDIQEVDSDGEVLTSRTADEFETWGLDFEE